MSTVLKACADCGELSTSTRCPEHTDAKASAHRRGYDAAWRRLSERARKLSPLCEDCGTTTDLTVDHSPEAWARKARGLPIRLQDVAVLCRSCNSRKGAAR